MLRFFRMLRKKLLRQGRFSQYALYAIGEVTLVVLGILIALQINNWNEGLKAQHKAQGYIENLMSIILHEMSETEKYLGDSPNFFDKIGVELKKEQMVQGLNHQHLVITKTRQLASTIIYVGSRLKEESKLALQLLDQS